MFQVPGHHLQGGVGAEFQALKRVFQGVVAQDQPQKEWRRLPEAFGSAESEYD